MGIFCEQSQYFLLRSRPDSKLLKTKFAKSYFCEYAYICKYCGNKTDMNISHFVVSGLGKVWAENVLVGENKYK